MRNSTSQPRPCTVGAFTQVTEDAVRLRGDGFSQRTHGCIGRVHRCLAAQQYGWALTLLQLLCNCRRYCSQFMRQLLLRYRDVVRTREVQVEFPGIDEADLRIVIHHCLAQAMIGYRLLLAHVGTYQQRGIHVFQVLDILSEPRHDRGGVLVREIALAQTMIDAAAAE